MTDDQADRARTDVEATIDEESLSEGDYRRRVTRLLPDHWTVSVCSVDLSDGTVQSAWRVELVHDDGPSLKCWPVDSQSDCAGPKIYDSHRIWLVFADDTRTVVASPEDKLFDDVAVFEALVAAARRFSSRYQLFHGP